MTQPIYLDNNATTRVDPAVVEEMLPFFTEQFGNASSTHAYGSAVGTALKQARTRLQSLLGAQFDHEIVYTSGGTESDNTALLSALDADPGRNEIVTTAVEHPAILTTCAWLEKARGVKVHYIGVDESGRLDTDALAAVLGPKTALLSVMWANNETGAIFPVTELAKQAHAAGALFHTDAVQAVGKIPIDLKTTEIDMLSLSGHKIHGPKGVGALYVRKGVKLTPLIRGGRQERARRAGTENAPGIIGLGKAAEIAAARLQDEQVGVLALRNRLEQGVLSAIPDCFVVGAGAERLPNTADIAFDCLESEAILTHLEKEGIAASSGSACASGSMEPSHVLRAMKVRPTALQGAIRFSLSRDTKPEEIDRVVGLLPPIVEKLRSMSPLWKERAAARAGTAVA